MPALRIASLVPSLTELLFALGLGGHVVARTGFCIHPQGDVDGVPKVGGTKAPDLARLRALAPSHVLVNVDENRLETVDALREFVPNVLITHPRTVHDNFALMTQLVEAFDHVPGVRDRAVRLTTDLRQALAITMPAVPCAVLYLIWRRPWMTVARDTYISSLLSTVGWQTLPAQDGGPSGAARYPVLDAADPVWGTAERVLLSSEPYAFEARHRAEVQALAPQARVELVDGELLSWYGPRAAAAVRYLVVLAGSATQFPAELQHQVGRAVPDDLHAHTEQDKG